MATKKRHGKKSVGDEAITKKQLHDQKLKEYELQKRRPIAGGGLAMRGYGKAYMKGGKVK